MIKFNANTEVSVNCADTQTKKKLPTIAKPPMRIGSPAAISEPKTKIKSNRISGTAINSARVRSSLMVELISALIAANPAT